MKNKVVSMIVKPEDQAQGRGIFITRRLEDINSAEHLVVQRYMRSPYLIDGYKFDFRIYVLVTSCDPLKIFLYNEGMVRFATEEWDIQTCTNYDNLFMHLTNYAINKENNMFISENPADDIGHKRLLSTVMNRLKKEGVDTDVLKAKIEDIIYFLELHTERKLEKLENKREDLQKRIVERTSYKESIQKKKEELEVLKSKREKYEAKNLGHFKIIFPNSDPEKHEKYLEHLKASSCTVPYPVSKTLSNQAQNVQKASSFKEDLRKKNLIASENKAKSSGNKNKSPYNISIRRVVTPASQKQNNKRGSNSNTQKTKIDSNTLGNSTSNNFHKNNKNLYESPVKAMTEKIKEDFDFTEEQKDEFYLGTDPAKNNLSGFCTLKKRGSINKYSNLRNDANVIYTNDDAISNYLQSQEDGKPPINLPMVKQEGKHFLSTETRTDSYSKLDTKYCKEVESSITGLRYPVSIKDPKHYIDDQSNSCSMPSVDKQLTQKPANFTYNILNEPIRTSRQFTIINKSKIKENGQQVHLQKEALVHIQN